MDKPRMNVQTKPLQLLAAMVIDFFRWSQLAPMVIMWGFMLVLLLALFIISYEDATWTLFERVMELIASLPVIGPRFTAWLEAQAQDGTISFSPGKVDPFTAVLKVWGVISVVFMVLSWIAGRIFGPFKPWTLGRKLGVTALACMLVIITFIVLYFLDKASWNDPLSKVILTSSAMAFILFIVSAWCLSISHMLGWLSGVVAEADFSKPDSNSVL